MITSFGRRFSLLLLCVLCGIAGQAHADTLTVTDPGDSGAGTLRDTITAAASGDTIVFAIPGPITLASGQIVIDKDLTITGPAGGITVRRQVPTDRIFSIGNGSSNGPTVLLTNLTIDNGGNPSSSGGIPESGGGIYNNNSNLTLQNSTVQNCTAGGAMVHQPSGGGIYSTGSNASLTVVGCRFIGNFATTNGGAIANAGGTLAVYDFTFTENDSERSSAHLHSSGTSPSLIRNSTFAAGRGSGALGNSGVLEITNCTFYENEPFGTSPIGIVNGGNGVLTVQHCTLFNTSGSSRGAITNIGSGALTLRNTIVANADGDATIVNDSSMPITSQGYNLVTDGGGGNLNGPFDQLNTDPKLDPAGLLNHGGPTKTIALLAGSPAIDRGNSFGTNIDQRGAPRPVDNPGVTNLVDGSDIGAYEAPADPIQGDASSLIVTTAADHDDGVCGATDCTLREAIARSNAVPGPNTITFTPPTTGTITLLPAAGGQLNITEGVTIIGPGARFLKISANTQTRVFQVSGTGSSTISGLTIADGRVGNSNAGDSEGGGIYNQATLSLVDCTIDFNRAIGGSGFMTGQNGGSGRGGGIFNAGALTLTRCTFKNNGAFGGSGAAYPPPPMTITFGGSGGDGHGAGVYNHTGASLNAHGYRQRATYRFWWRGPGVGLLSRCARAMILGGLRRSRTLSGRSGLREMAS